MFDNANNIENVQNRLYIDLRHSTPDASKMHIIITSLNLTIKNMTSLKTIRIIDIKFSKTIEMFRQCVKIQNLKLNVKTKINHIVKKLKYLILIITLIESYVFVTFVYCQIFENICLNIVNDEKIYYVDNSSNKFIDTKKACWIREFFFNAIATQNSTTTRLFDVLTFMNFDDIFFRIFDRIVDQNDNINSKQNTTCCAKKYCKNDIFIVTLKIKCFAWNKRNQYKKKQNATRRRQILRQKHRVILLNNFFHWNLRTHQNFYTMNHNRIR